MCNYVPGECYAIGPLNDLDVTNRSDPELPGNMTIEPLAPEVDPNDDVPNPFNGIGVAHVRNIPHGLELFAVSLLAAKLSDSVLGRKAVVDLNYYLPFSALPSYRSEKPSLSPRARDWAHYVKSHFRLERNDDLPPVGMIDSGINTSSLGNRQFTSIDYSNGAANELSLGQDCDKRGHGTKVARLLDEVLPPSVAVVSGKLSDNDRDVTVLNLIRSYAHLTSKYKPSVVNISLAPRNDRFSCPECGEETCVPSFYSTALPDVIRLAGTTTFTVMASGNTGQENNFRYAKSDVPSLIFVSSIGSDGLRSSYSGYSGPSPRHTAYAFGGDDPSVEDGMGVFQNDRKSYGTSFAAPFVSGMAYVALQHGVPIDRDKVFETFHYNDMGGWIPIGFPHRRR